MARCVNIPNMKKCVKFNSGGILSYQMCEGETPFVYLLVGGVDGVEDPNSYILVNLKTGLQSISHVATKQDIMKCETVEELLNTFGFKPKSLVSYAYFEPNKYDIEITEV